MAMARRWRRILTGLGGAMLVAIGLVGAAEAANCGDTAGPRRTRIACACGDTVVTSTRLRATDPVVTSRCTDQGGDGLVIGADNITLDCAGRTIAGDGLSGIFGVQSRVTITRCRIEGPTDGIALSGRGNRILANRVANTFGGIVVEGNDTWLVGNRIEDCHAEGILIQEGRQNSVWGNEVFRCFDGVVVDGHASWISGNTASDNTGSGFVVRGTGNELIANTATRNGSSQTPLADQGYLVTGTGNTLFGNVARTNVGKGFCVAPGNVNAGLNVPRGNGETPEADFDCADAALLARELSD